MKQKVRLLLAGVCMMGILSCSSLFSTSIDKILQNPRDYLNKKVSIYGMVEQASNLVFVKFFIVRDRSGAMHVITQKNLPAKGQKIKVTGKIEEAFSLGNQQMLVLVEEDNVSR